MQTDPLVDFLLSYRFHSLKYQKSTTQAWKDIEIRIYNLWRMFSSFCVLYVTYKVSKKALVYKPR